MTSAAILGRSTDNSAVIAEMTLVEFNKWAAVFQTRQRLNIQCRHPGPGQLLADSASLAASES